MKAYSLPPKAEFVAQSARHTLKELATIYGVSYGTCHNWRVHYHCTPHGKHPGFREVFVLETGTPLALLAAHPEGVSCQELADLRGTSRQAALSTLTRLLARGLVTRRWHGTRIVYQLARPPA